ncbi:MAG TPA: hypothetical protein VMU28_01320 [Terriglobales bacterium]|nr:hypothetical protein [Terriglobales bacterium]
MLRSLLLATFMTLGFAFGASGQVIVNGGYATTYPADVPASIANTVTQYDIPSVPAINTPIVHVGPTAQVGPETTAVPSPATPIVAGIPQGGVPAEETGEPQQFVPPLLAVLPAAGGHQPLASFSFGAAQYSVNPFVSGGSENPALSLGEIAREYKQKQQNVNAKSYTNTDIERLQGNTYGAGAAAVKNDNWPSNNGVITPPPPPAVAAPQQNQSTTGTAPVAPPVTPRPQNPPSAPTPQPQSFNQKPSPDHPVEMAQNTPADESAQNAAQASQSNANANASQDTLPKTATRLPLLGVLGFFSVAMGLFVRHQRNKTTRQKRVSN